MTLHTFHIELNKILVSRPILYAVKKIIGEDDTKDILKTYKFKLEPSASFTPLNRLDRLNTFDFVNTTPIDVKEFSNTGYYRILNGRHRVAIAISRELASIPVIIHE